MVEENDGIELSILEIIEYILRPSCNHWGQVSDKTQGVSSMSAYILYFTAGRQQKYIRKAISVSEKCCLPPDAITTEFPMFIHILFYKASLSSIDRLKNMFFFIMLS